MTNVLAMECLPRLNGKSTSRLRGVAYSEHSSDTLGSKGSPLPKDDDDDSSRRALSTPDLKDLYAQKSAAGFKMEDVINNFREKLQDKNLDRIVQKDTMILNENAL